MELNLFLVKAKVKTYASNEDGIERILDDESKELVFSEGGWKYRDRYFGFNPFIGEEIVWRDNAFMWGMNYWGVITSEVVSAKEVYKFLQKALQLVKKDKPFRGPPHLKEDDFEYFNESEGNIERFRGQERILYRGEEIYHLDYHGGLIKKRSL